MVYFGDSKLKIVFKYLLFVALFLFSFAVVVGLFLPTQYEVSRSVRIAAGSGTIHRFVGDLRKWELWEPWSDGDPSLLTTLGEQTQGVGASSSWRGRDGEGSLRFTASDPESGIAMDLFFNKGQWQSTSEIRYRSISAELTEVQWSMQGQVEAAVVGGYLALLMDRMIGPMYETGLSRLKKLAEKAEAPIPDSNN